MILFRPLVVLGLAVVMMAGASASLAEKPNKGAGKKGLGGVRGVVVAVEKATDKDEGTISVKLISRKKKGATETPAVEKKFRVTKATKFELVSGKKDALERKPASFADIKNGQGVLIIAKSDGNVAERVEIRGSGKGKKKKQVD